MRVPAKNWVPLFLLSILPALFATTVFAQFNYSSSQDDPPGTIARIGYLDGGVSLQAVGTDEWSQAPINYPMVAGDRLYTNAGARAIVQLGGAELRIWQLTDVSLVNSTDQYQQIGLASGNLRLHVAQMEPGSQIEVDTPNGAVIVESPGDYRIEAFPQNGGQNGSSIVTINSGNAQITGPGINQPISGGYSIGLFGSNPVELQYLDVPDYDDLDYWSFDLDRRLQNSISARYVSRQMVGYADLDANGTWNPDSEYGPVWYPNNVPYGWQPYSTGHWAYVQPWGYTWVDDESWGFAPFHYGRWAVIDGRWGWVPGPPAIRPVYSPALVAFVGGGPGGGGGLSIGIGFGGGGGISAWFPIGVGEPYVPWYRCSPNYARQVNVTNVNVAAIRNTTIVNNYNTYINKTVINNTTVNNTTINNTTVNNVTVNNFNYANKAKVVAVPASAMSSGTSVARQAVQLSPQQRQQIASAPISVRPTAPVPERAHPSLLPAVASVARPAARPVLMTPTGQARAVPTAVRPHPVAIAALPAPKVVPRNAAPPPVAAKPLPVNRPATGSAPVSTAPVAVRAPAAVVRPNAPVNQPAGNQPPSGVVRPGTPVARPVTPVQPIQPVARPVQPAVRPAPQPIEPVAPVTRPVPTPQQPVQPAVRPVPPAPQPRPVPPAAERPAQPQPAPRPEQPPAPVVRPVPQQRPVPPPPPVQVPPRDAVRPLPPVKPGERSAPKENEKPAPKDEPKQDHPNR